MFRPNLMDSFRLLRKDLFYNTVQLYYNYIVEQLLTQKPEYGHVDWPKHVA
jgi:hypothetical protein